MTKGGKGLCVRDRFWFVAGQTATAIARGPNARQRQGAQHRFRPASAGKASDSMMRTGKGIGFDDAHRQSIGFDDARISSATAQRQLAPRS
jgi:hypothetical protein